MKKNNLNATACRIFKLLEWLQEKPLSAEDMNQRFLNDPVIGKAVSSDTLWLYLNTLKALGCSIGRPSPSNVFTYQMHSNPFGVYVTQADVDAVLDARKHVEGVLTCDENLKLDKFLALVFTRSMLVHAGNEGQLDTDFSEELNYYKLGRIVDYRHSEVKIQELKRLVQAKQATVITYDSHMKGTQRLGFMPESLMYNQGILYLQGYRKGFEELSNLRVDKMIGLKPMSNDDDETGFESEKENSLGHYVIRIYVSEMDDFQSLELDEEIEYVTEGEKNFLRLYLKTPDRFTLRQKLLECGYLFEIESPRDFAAEMHATLSSMLQFYGE